MITKELESTVHFRAIYDVVGVIGAEMEELVRKHEIAIVLLIY